MAKVILNLENHLKVPKKGTIVSYWWASEGTEVLGSRPYTGRYKEYFTHFIKLKVDNREGFREVCFQEK